MASSFPSPPGSDCGAGDAAFCKFHPGVCAGCRRASEGPVVRPARKRPDRLTRASLMLTLVGERSDRWGTIARAIERMGSDEKREAFDRSKREAQELLRKLSALVDATEYDQ